MNKDARAALDSVGMDQLSEGTPVGGLPVGYMQFIEIAREIDKKGMKLLVFDEPTAVLTESEAEQLIHVMKDIAARGIAIIFITHRLGEVMDAADSITILRDGQLVATREKTETSAEELAALMIGRSGETPHAVERSAASEERKVAMKIRNLVVDMPGEAVKGADLDVFEGEILGIGGLAGQGKIGLPNGVMGLYPAEGEVELFGKKLSLNHPRQALASGLAMVSEDRRGVGLLLDQSIEDNIAFNAMQVKGEFLKKGFPVKDTRAIRRYAEELIRTLDIRCTSARAAYRNTLRRQPAEGVRGARAGAEAEVPVRQRADARHRHRSQAAGAGNAVPAEPRNGADDRDGLLGAAGAQKHLPAHRHRIGGQSSTGILRPDSSAVSFGLAMSGAEVEGSELV